MILAFFVLSCTATLYLYFYFRLATIAPLKRVFSSFPRLTTSNSSALKNHKCSTRSMQAHEPTSETHAIFKGHRTQDDLLGGHGSKTPKRIIVAMTGATGSILGVHLLKILKRMNIETHLIVSKWAAATLVYETDFTVKDLKALATRTYAASDVAAPISSGSFKTLGMIVVPCSMKTLSAVATGFGEDLVTRAADVVLKERRKFVVVARETPLNAIHLNNMLTITNSGGIIFPPVPAFYTKPQSVDDIVSQSVGRMLDMFDLDTEDFERWTGMH